MLTEAHKAKQAKEAGSASANPSKECPWCKVANPIEAEFCLECGRKQLEEVVKVVPAVAAVLGNS
jgi:ribosomal protein L40E